MKRHLITSFLYTVITAVLFGLVYPLGVTLVAHVLFPVKASGQLIVRNGKIIGSRLIGQPFAGAGYFHSRPSAAGASYDAANSSGSNLGETNQTLIDRIEAGAASESAGTPVPVDLVTASGSGLDPDITPAAALYHAPRVAAQRGIPLDQIQNLVAAHLIQRQFGLLGEPRVNVVEVNLALDQLAAQRR